MKDGCRDALVLWGEILVDGHNRYEICTRHNIPFNTVQMDFSSRDDVVIWIIKNQFGRRNLPAYERAKLALRLKPVIAEKAKEKEETRKTTFQKSEKSNMPEVNTTKELAKVAGVSHDTIAKVEKIEQKATPEIKTQLQTGEISINQAYKTVKKEEIAFVIIDKSYISEQPKTAVPEKPKAVEPSKPVIEKKSEPPKQSQSK